MTLNDQTFNIEAVDPPAPTVELSSKYNFKDNIYMVPMTGNYLGDAIINSERADLDITISRNSDVLESETFTPGWEPPIRCIAESIQISEPCGRRLLTK
ncbi:hypothetical protein PCI56_04795 [Plesiomonas shigelloides subsp. oncorhynchi]|nr:hypothetical protein [Plesiomonas shigelloides]